MSSKFPPRHYLRKVGNGSFGDVCQISDGLVVKFYKIEDSTGFVSVRELSLLRDLAGHPNIIQLVSCWFLNPCDVGNPLPDGSFIPVNPDWDIDRLALVFPKANSNMTSLNDPISLEHFRMLAADILSALEYIHGKGMTHRDLKTGNLLLFDGPSVKICDFGSAIYGGGWPSNSCGTTPCQRSPEVATLGIYSQAMDMWSFGCILYELMFHRQLIPIVDPHATNDQVMESILSNIPFDEEDMNYLRNNWSGATGRSSVSHETFFFSYSYYLTRKITQAEFNQLYDLIINLLRADPARRLTASAALEHPFFDSCRTTIEQVRVSHPPVRVEETVLLIATEERRQVGQLAASYLKGTQPKGGDARIAFTAIDIYDMWVEHSVDNHPPAGTMQGKFYTCLYLAYKFWVIDPDSLSKLIGKEATKVMEEFITRQELDIIRKTTGKLYRPNILESLAPTMSRNEVIRIVNVYCQLPSGEYQHNQLAELIRIAGG